MPNPATSWASDSDSPSSAHFEALYPPSPGQAATPLELDTCTMCPAPWARRTGSAAWVTCGTPKRLTSSCARSCSGVISSTVPNSP